MSADEPRGHPLPYALQGGWVSLESSSRDDERPFRVIAAGGAGRGYDDEALGDAVRRRLEHLRQLHPAMEVATESEPSPAGHVAEQWATWNDVPLLLFPSLDDALTAGGSRLLIVAGPEGAELATAAHQMRIAVDLIRIGVTAG